MLSNFLASQMASNSGVSPEYRFAEGKFYLNSEAGLIIFKPKKESEIARFRNEWVNRFDSICKDFSAGKKTTRQFFRFYRELRSKEKVKYRANFRTRVAGNLYAI